MRRPLAILSLLFAVCLFADNRYVDDIYYTPSLSLLDDAETSWKPYYDSKRIKEFVFVDTVFVEPADTLRPVSSADTTVVNQVQ